MKFGKLLIIPVLAGLLCGCGDARLNVELLPGANVEYSALAMFSHSGGQTEYSHLFDAAQEQEILDGLKKLPVYSGDDVDLSSLSGDIYALRIGTGEGDVSGLWQDGVWITDDGAVYRTEVDFPAITENYDWKESGQMSMSTMPNIHYLAKYGGKWNTAYLSKSSELSESRLKLEILKVENNTVYTKVTNPTADEECIGLGFGLLVKLDGEWYDVPPEQEMAFNDIALIIPAGESVEQNYDFSGYGELPAGDYRIVTDHGAADFTL